MDLNSINFDKFKDLYYYFFMFKRIYEPLDKYIKPNKALVIYGPRRVGKTTLLQNYLQQTKLRYRLDSGDNIRLQQLLGSKDFKQILPYAEGYELIAIDEAQNIPNIGESLKIIVDQVPGIKVIVTGSSSFELAGQVGEPLTGRKNTLILYPMSQLELSLSFSRFELMERIEDFLVYGSYPEIVQVTKEQEKIELIFEITDSYLLKDILAFDRVKKSRLLTDLLKLLAFQIGKEVSLNELSVNLRADIKTVQRYLDLLEKAFIIKIVSGFSRNLRNEIVNKNKYFFIDNGIRNAVIAQFNKLDQRNDVGELWENFIFIERLKFRDYSPIHSNFYFWRTYEGQEIDLVEEREGKLFGYEFKWSDAKKIKPPRNWIENYPEAMFKVISGNNYLDYVT
jgi:predicted AAA+ superfamily ATPase